MIRGIIGFISLLTFVPVLALAQDDEPRTGYIYVTYFICDTARETRADEIIDRTFAPHYNAAVEAGDIVSWSWLAHYVGGPWRRALVLTATNMDDLLDASGALGEIIGEATPEAGRVFTEVCAEHVDYVWQTVDQTMSAPMGTERGSAGFSMYLECDLSEERRADEIVAETIGPIYNDQIAKGNLKSWSWLQHNVGGNFRRLLTSTADDHKTMMRARAEIIAQMAEGRTRRAADQLNEICPKHQDYMWDIQIETP